MRVLIVGAGVGGLCLAHGLRAAGVTVRVLERRGSAAEQPASYGIHLNADGLRALHACLPAANWRLLTEAAGPARDAVCFHDQRLRLLAERDHEPVDPDPITRRRAVRRDALRDALLAGLDDVVHWDRRVVGYTTSPAGPVRVRCADGQEYEADVVVGADGGPSAIRALRLPELDRVDLGVRTIAGRAPLTAELARALPESLVDGAVHNIVPAGPGWMFVSTWHTDPAEVDGDSARAERYVVWAWAAAEESYPAEVDHLPARRLRDLVLDRTADFSPAVRALITATDPTTVATIPLRTMPELPPWTPSTVTLLGDAVHAMTPMAGLGANTALRDADELRRALLDPTPRTQPVAPPGPARAITRTDRTEQADGTERPEGTEQTDRTERPEHTGPTDRAKTPEHPDHSEGIERADLIARIGRYETAMREYANAALRVSTRNARNAAATARMPRLAFRTVLRLAEAVPPVKRALFG